MKMKIRKTFAFALVFTVCALFISSCQISNQPALEFTVRFDLNYPSQELIPAQNVKSGETAKEPAIPERENYTFKGWFTDSELLYPFSFESEKINKDMTLYAGWSQSLYYIAGNFTGYEAKKEGFNLEEVKGMEGWLHITVELTDEVRDKVYDGHYYKITNGTWDANGCWGVDNYALQPAPASPTGGGLGSIWIYENRTLTVYFDTVNMVIYDNSMVSKFATPRIYGDFNTAMARGNDWSTKDGEALELFDPEGDGIYKGLYKLPAYKGTNADGYSMAVAVSEKYYIDEWGNRWGVDEQYKFDGQPGGMAGVSNLKPSVDTIYEFSYDSTTKVTSVTPYAKDQVVRLQNPVIYGDFSGWLYEGGGAIELTDYDGDGVFTALVKLEPYKGTAEGYMMAVMLSKRLYDDEWGIRFGAEEQYKFDGNPAGMGGVSYLKPLEGKIYEFKYDSRTKITSVEAFEKDQVVGLINPTVYGDFSNWVFEGEKAFILKDENNSGIFTGILNLPAHKGTGDGYMMAVAISKKLYDDEWGIRWGIEEQYKFSGDPAGMGGVSFLKPSADTTYVFSYNSHTKVTSVTVK